MIVRIRFAKYGALKFIGHLDVMRYFQKAIRRAELPVIYSEGFHPHQVMSFALPLGLGITSDGEYLDVAMQKAELKTEFETFTTKLNKVLSPGLFILSAMALPEEENNKKPSSAMALVNAADYFVSLKDSFVSSLGGFLEWQKKFIFFLEQPNILVKKKSKKTEREINLKEALLHYAFSYSDFYENKTDRYRIVHAEHFKNESAFYVRLFAGSAYNVKPELLLESFCDFSGVPYQRFDYKLHRMELYLDGWKT